MGIILNNCNTGTMMQMCINEMTLQNLTKMEISEIVIL